MIYPNPRERACYAWIIDIDHLAKPGDEPGSTAYNAATVTGPSDAPDDLLATLAVGAELAPFFRGRLPAVVAADPVGDVYEIAAAAVDLATVGKPIEVRTSAFRMYDDDGELYYSGRLAQWVGHDCSDCNVDPDFGPLNDFGTPNAGATDIRYRDDVGEWVSL